MTSNKTVYAGWEKTGVPDRLNGDDHFAYIIGRDDGLVHPEATITRAEVATIFFRLLTDEARAEYLTETSPFHDVAPRRVVRHRRGHHGGHGHRGGPRPRGL